MATATTAMFYDSSLIQVLAYSFSNCNGPARSFTQNKVCLDILFEHPRTAETITLRTIVPDRLLCSTREEVENAVYREIRNTLRIQSSGMA